MGDAPGPPSQSAISPSLLSRIRHSPATSGAAMALFVVLSALWLVAAVTAQVWYHSAPPGYVFSSRSGFYAWVGVGIAGTVLALGSVVHRLWSVRRGPVSVILTICIAVAAELLLVLVVTRHAIATAPYGVDSGEGAAAIATLGLAQVVLVAMLMALIGRSTRLVSRVVAAHMADFSGSVFLAPLAWLSPAGLLLLGACMTGRHLSSAPASSPASRG
ncbi:MAG: hypothetical protein ACLQQM_06300 [Acidimicrobiales bacterium]